MLKGENNDHVRVSTVGLPLGFDFGPLTIEPRKRYFPSVVVHTPRSESTTPNQGGDAQRSFMIYLKGKFFAMAAVRLPIEDSNNMIAVVIGN